MGIIIDNGFRDLLDFISMIKLAIIPKAIEAKRVIKNMKGELNFDDSSMIQMIFLQFEFQVPHFLF